MAAFRLYRSAPPGMFEVTLVHGAEDQEYYDVFHRQVMLSPCTASPVTQWRFVRAGKRWLRAHAKDFDVFHGLGAYDNTIEPALLAERLGLPSFVKVTVHQGDLADKSGVRRLLGRPRRRRRLLKHLSGVIAISSDIEKELSNYGLASEHIFSIPNAVDTGEFRPPIDSDEVRALRIRFGWPSLPIILFSGKILPRKHPHLLVDAMVELERLNRSVAVVLVGPFYNDHYIADIKAKARDANMGERLIVTGGGRDIAPMYRAADVFCLPSENEGMPNALLEAMASGLPPVVTPVSGSRDVVQDGVNGTWVEADSGSITQAIAQYLNNPALRVAHGREARQAMVDGYSTQHVLEAHERMFRRHAVKR